MEHKYLTVAEAADYLRVSNMTIYRALYDGKLKAGKVGQNWRITREALDELITPREK